MYIGKPVTANTVAFLKSAKVTSFTHQVDDTHANVKTINGKKIVPAGSVFPANDATAEGIIYNDVDVTQGPQPVAVIVEGHILLDRLPVAPVAAAQTAMREIKLYDSEGSMLPLP